MSTNQSSGVVSMITNTAAACEYVYDDDDDDNNPPNPRKNHIVYFLDHQVPMNNVYQLANKGNPST